MSMPIELKGIIRGNMIELPDRTFLPDGYEVTLHLILTRQEALTLAAGFRRRHDAGRNCGRRGYSVRV